MGYNKNSTKREAYSSKCLHKKKGIFQINNQMMHLKDLHEKKNKKPRPQISGMKEITKFSRNE